MSLNLALVVEQPAPGARHRRRAAGGQERRALRCSDAGRAWRRARRAAWRWRLPRAASSLSCCSPPASPCGVLERPVVGSAVRRRDAVDGGDAAAAAARRDAGAAGGACCAPSTPCPRTTATSSSPASAASARSSPASWPPSTSPSPRSIPTPSTSTSCASSARASSTATPAGRRSWMRRRPARRAPSCWRSTTSRPRSGRRSWCASTIRNVPIYARSRHRRHTHQLMDLGIKIIRRETFLSSLDLTREVLRGLGLPEREVRFAVDTFQAHGSPAAVRGLQALHGYGEAAGARPYFHAGAGGAVRPGRGRAGQGGCGAGVLVGWIGDAGD